MKARIVRIGNSRGIRLPKSILDQAQLGDEVELNVRDGMVVISRPSRPRQGWAEAAALLADRGEHGLLLEPSPTRFEEDEWEW